MEIKEKIENNDSDSNPHFSFSEYPLFLIAHIQRQNFINLSKSLKTYGMITLEWRVLAQLQEKDDISVSELAIIVISERSALSRVISNMEDKGFVQRSINTKDKRATSVYITKKGREMFETILPLVQKQLDWTLHDLSEKEKSDLVSLLVKLNRNVHRSPFA